MRLTTVRFIWRRLFSSCKMASDQDIFKQYEMPIICILLACIESCDTIKKEIRSSKPLQKKTVMYINPLITKLRTDAWSRAAFSYFVHLFPFNKLFLEQESFILHLHCDIYNMNVKWWLQTLTLSKWCVIVCAR